MKDEIIRRAERQIEYSEYINKHYPSERKAMSVDSYNAVRNMIKEFPELEECYGTVNGCYIQYWCQIDGLIFDPTWRKFGNIERTYCKDWRK